ncbi:MAG: NAD(P)H-hydrate dehydratase [Candidatus Bathyarchaeota archaeon]|nr:NAD(P)H-hydrate dehydratase [Candidatus Bathyarchaeota archaeon]
MQAKNKIPTITSREMRALEINAEYFGINLLQLMENAGRSVAQEIVCRFQKNKKAVIFCGLGGNGGDGFVVARHLLSSGFEVTVVLVGRGREISHPAALCNWGILQSLQGKVVLFEVTDSSAIPKVNGGLVVDALLGTGTKGKLKARISQVVDYINSLGGFKIAVDVPTGIDSDTGEVLGNAIKADLTITFHKAKLGLEKAKKYVGELVVADIGLPLEFERFAGPGDVLLAKKPRAPTAHKGDFGRLLVIGGSEVFSGAPTLVSLAALRTGVDIAYVASPTKTAYAIASMSPDLITIKLEGNNLKPSNIETLKPYIGMVDAVVMGPGLGLNPETQQFVKECVAEVEEAEKPLLLDADGLKAFAKFKRQLKVPLVLTPHAGEYAILTGEELPENLEDKAAAIQKAAKKLKATILVKGKVDIICDAERVKLNFTGNPGMTVGGTGDVLSGVVGALLAQKVNVFEAAVAGAFVNGAAGDFVASEFGFHMVATDIVEWIPKVFEDPMSHLKVRKPSGN